MRYLNIRFVFLFRNTQVTLYLFLLLNCLLVPLILQILAGFE